MADARYGYNNGAESPQLETVFGPDGSVVTSPVLPPGTRLYATTTQSEFGADRVYTGETYAAPPRRDPPPPPTSGTRGVLRRSLSSRTGGLGLAQEETPATKLKRKVSWAGDTVRLRRVAPCCCARVNRVVAGARDTRARAAS